VNVSSRCGWCCAVALLLCVSGRAVAAPCAGDPSDPSARPATMWVPDPCPSDPLPPWPPAPPTEHDRRVTPKSVITSLPGDQLAIWTSPRHLRPRDTAWLVPLGLTTAGLIGSDQHSMVRVHSNANVVSESSTFANAGLGGMVALPAFMYVFGSLEDKPRMRETGLLAGEAAVNALAVNQLMKLAFARERPTPTDGAGRFFTTQKNASFPSAHAMLSWSIASVIAHEYPGPVSTGLAYAAAAAVSASRLSGRDHFPSDVLVGGALGWLVGRQMYRAHHDTSLEDGEYGSFDLEKGEFDPDALGSPYVPLDSWIYPALKRLAARGYIQSQIAGIEPWTRSECLRQIAEAEDAAQDLPDDSDVKKTIAVLKAEFTHDNEYFESAQIDSVYMRSMTIAGTPLRDSYHFGQTITGDLGRPYDQGENFITGATASGVAGPFFFFAQGEYEHAPGRGAPPPSVPLLIAALDQNPASPGAPVSGVDRFYPLDFYAGLRVGGYSLTFGKQTLWLGPGESTPLMLSDNADPMYMLRLAHTSPIILPWIFKYLGPMQDEYLFGKLSGHRFPARPFFNLQKISFHPTKNLEIGFTRSSLWAGAGHPFTLGALKTNLFSFGDQPTSTPGALDPGDRKSGLDFSYRLPFLRDWLTVYSDFYSDDDPSPLAAPRRAAMSPGIYLSHFPRIPKLDFRLESTSTQLLGKDHGGEFLYWNITYHDSNLNKGFLFGSPVGRDAREYRASSTYHFAPATSLQLTLQQRKISSLFLPGGGTQTDVSSRLVWQVRPQWSVQADVQGERWLIPSLAPGVQHDVTGSFEVIYTPHWRIHDRTHPRDP
jgi:capsule assembly protein Wzi/PAP2 superfamily protein